MQNLLVIIFPLLIDGLNSVAGLDNPKVKYWVALITSLLGGALLNLPMIEQVVSHPSVYNASATLTLLGLIVAATQGLYVKYWENHSIRPAVFPTVTGANAKDTTTEVPVAPIVEPAVATEPASPVAN